MEPLRRVGGHGRKGSSAASNDAGLLASSQINIQVGAVPLPATLPLLLGAVAFIRRKRAA